MNVKRIHYIQGFSILLIITLIFTVFVPLKKKLDARILALKDSIVGIFEERTGRTVSIRKISPSILRDIELTDLTIYGASEEPDVLFHFRTIKLKYDLVKLLSGMFLESLREISFENSEIDLDSRTDQDLFLFIQNLLVGERTELPPIVLSGKNLSISLQVPQGDFSFRNLSFKLFPGDNSFLFDVKSRIDAGITDIKFPIRHIDSLVSFTGEAPRDLSAFELLLKVRSFSTELFTLSPQTFQVSISDSEVSCRKIQDKTPVDVSLLFDRVNENIDVTVTGEAFRPDTIFHPEGRLTGLSEFLEMRLTGTGNLTFRTSTGSYGYSGDFFADSINARNEWLRFISGRVEGDDRFLFAEGVRIGTSFGDALFTGKISLDDFIPEGVALLQNATYENYGPLSAEIKIERLSKKNSIRVTSGAVTIGTFRSGGFSAEVVYSDDVFDFQADVLMNDHAENGSISLEGTYVRGESPFLQVFGRAVRLPVLRSEFLVRSIVRDFHIPAIPDIADSMVFSGDISFITDFKKFSLSSPTFRMIDTVNVKRSFSAEVALSSTNLTARNIVSEWDGLRFAGRISADISDFRRMGISCSILYENNEFDLSGVFIPGKQLILRGENDLELEIAQDGDGSLAFRFLASDLKIFYGEYQPIVSTALFGTFKSTEDWAISVTSLQVHDLPFLSKRSRISLSGHAGPGTCIVRKLTFTDEFSTIRGEGEIQVSFPDFSKMDGNINLRNDDGLEAYDLSFVFDRRGLNGKIRFQKAPLERLGIAVIRGRTSGTASLNGTFDTPEATISLNLENAFYENKSVGGSADIELTSRSLLLHAIDIRYEDTRINSNSASIDLESGSISAGFSVEQLIPGNPVRAKVGLTGTLDKPRDIIRDPESLLKKNMDAIVSVSEIRIADGTSAGWSVRIKKRSNRFTFTGGPQNGFSGFMDLPGKFELAVSGGLPVTCKAAGTIDNGVINADVSDIVFDMAVFNGITRNYEFEFTGGKVSGDLRVQGAIGDPEIFGTLSIVDSGAVTRLSPDKVGPMNGTVVFQGKTIIMPKVRTKAGEGTFTVEGQSSIDHWNPSPFRFSIITEGDKGLHIVYTFANLKVNGYGKGTISITSNSYRAEINGKVNISDCIIALDEGSNPMKYDFSTYGLNVNLDFSTGKKVSFEWPANTKMMTAVADIGQPLHVFFDSDADEYKVTGLIAIKSGEIFYLDRSFFIREGTISFQENQNSFDPRLTVRAETRAILTNGLTQENESARVYLVVDENRLSQFSPRFESDLPGTTSEAILSELGMGIFDAAFSNKDFYGSLQEAALLGVDIGSNYIMKFLENRIREALGLDLFSVRTSLLQNILRAGLVYSQPLDNSSVLGKTLDNTTLFIGKYLGNDLFFESMLQFRSTDYARLEERNLTGLRMDLELGLEWKTPLFTLDWSFKPRRPESLFLYDNVFSFSWKYSF